LYKNKLSTIRLINGFQDFFNILIKHGKYICIATDASRETFDILCETFPFLKKSNIIITRESVNKRKPDSECYIKIFQKLKQQVSLHDIIVFEDSYKGWTAAYNVIYNCVLVNHHDYIYYDVINPQNAISTFENILAFHFKPRFDYVPFYISSKTFHRDKWVKLRNTFPITSTWIDVNKNKEDITVSEKRELCNIIQSDIVRSSFGILYLEKNEKNHIGSLIEIGMLLSNSKQIYVCGDNLFKNEVLFNFDRNFNFSYVDRFDLFKVFNDIQYDMNPDYNFFKTNI